MPTPNNVSATLQVDADTTSETFALGYTAVARSVGIFVASYYSSASTMSSVTFGGTAMTLIQMQAATSGTATGRVYAWIAPNVAGSDNNLVVSYSGGSDNYVTGVAYQYLNGVLRPSPLGLVVGASGSSAAPSVVLPSSKQKKQLHGVMMNNSGNAACAITGPTGWNVNFTENNDSIHTAGSAAWLESNQKTSTTVTWAQVSGAWAALAFELYLAEHDVGVENSPAHPGPGPSMEMYGFSADKMAETSAGVAPRVTVAVDTVTFTDSAIASSNLVAVAVDTVTFTDSAIAASSIVAAATDAITFTDSAVAASSLVAVAADTVSFTDSAVANRGNLADGVDTITFTDSAIASSSLVAAATDTVSFTDSAVALTNRVAAATDTVSFTDSAVAITNRVAAATDTVSFTDSAVAASSLAAVAVDTVSFTDSAVASISTGPIIVTTVAADTVSFSDSAVASKVANLPNVFYGPGWPGWHVKQKRQPKQENRREELERIVTALYLEKTGHAPPPEVARNPQAADPAVVGQKVAVVLDAVQRAVEGVRGDVRVAIEIERARKAAEEELSRVKRRRRDEEFLLLME